MIFYLPKNCSRGFQYFYRLRGFFGTRNCLCAGLHNRVVPR
jgi:hypothetical protein